MQSPLGNGNISPAESSQGSYWLVSASMPRPLHRDLNENPSGPPVSLDPSLIMSCIVLWSSHRIQWSLRWGSTSRRQGASIVTYGHIYLPMRKPNTLLQLESAAQSRQATAFFSIKEAFYKYQFPITHAWVGFRDVSVHQEDASFYRLTAQINDATVAHNVLAVVEPVGTDQSLP